MLAGPADIAAAATRLKAGGIVAFPTETVYGLGADALNERAVARVFELKGRPSNNPLIVHVTSPSMASQVVAPGAWTREADQLAAAFWPGPLSIVLPKSGAVPGNVTGGGPNVAVRCPDHPVTLSLLQAFGGPLVGPSANPSGRVSPTTAAHVREAFSESDVLVLDGGPCRAGIESTVISLVGPPRILRPGVIGPDEISVVIDRVVAPARATSSAEPLAAPLESPGTLRSHYAPAAKTTLAEAPAIPDLMRRSPGPAVVISWSGLKPPAPHAAIRIAPDAAGYAASLYSALRQADSSHPALIIVERPPLDGDAKRRAIWAAVMDRLSRASAAQ